MFVFIDDEAEISLEMALRGHYRGKICHRDIDLVEDLPSPMSEKFMRECVGLLLAEGGNVGSSGPASLSQPAVRVVSLVQLPAPGSFDLSMGVQEEKGTALFRKRQSLRAVPSLGEVTESDDAGLHPRKMHKTVSVAKLLGGIDNVLGDKFSVPGQKERVVVPSSLVTPPSLLTGSLPVDLGFGSVLGVHRAHPEVLPSLRGLPRLGD